MQRVHAVQHDGGGAGAGERGGDFRADVAGFADADDDNFPARLERGDDGLDGAVEGFVELRADGLERGKFDVEHFTGLGKVAHAGEIARNAAGFQPRSEKGRLRRSVWCATSLRRLFQRP